MGTGRTASQIAGSRHLGGSKLDGATSSVQRVHRLCVDNRVAFSRFASELEVIGSPVNHNEISKHLPVSGHSPECRSHAVPSHTRALEVFPPEEHGEAARRRIPLGIREVLRRRMASAFSTFPKTGMTDGLSPRCVRRRKLRRFLLRRSFHFLRQPETSGLQPAVRASCPSCPEPSLGRCVYICVSAGVDGWAG